MNKMQFALAFFIIVLCLIPFLIGAGFGLEALLRYEIPSSPHPNKPVKSHGTSSPQVNQSRPMNESLSIDETLTILISRLNQIPTPLSLPILSTDFNNTIFKLQTKLIETDDSSKTSVISPLASTVTLLFIILTAGNVPKRQLCTAIGLKPKDFTPPLDANSKSVAGMKSLINILQPNVKPYGHYRIRVDNECHISDKILGTMTNLDVEVQKVDPIPFGPTVKFSTSMSFSIQATQFLDSCTKDSGTDNYIVATARRGTLESLDRAEFFELLPSSGHSRLNNHNLIIIRPPNERMNNIQSVKSRFSRLNFDDFSYSTKDNVKLSLRHSDVGSIHQTRRIFPSSIISTESFNLKGNLLGNYRDLCDNDSDKLDFSVNYDQDITFQIKNTDLLTCPAGTSDELEEVKIDNKFIMLLLNNKTILSFVIFDD